MLAVAIWFYSSFNPTGSEFFPKCSFLMITGLKCPGCGSQRALHALLNGDLMGALQYNAMLIISIPVLAVLLYAEWYRKKRSQFYTKIYAKHIVITIGILIVAWWIFRNIFNC